MTTKPTDAGRPHGAVGALLLVGVWVASLALIAALVRPAGAGLGGGLVGPVVAWLVLSAIVVVIAWTMRPRTLAARAWWPMVAAVSAYTFFFALYPYLVGLSLWGDAAGPVDARIPLLLMLVGAVLALVLLARWMGNQVFEYLKRRHGLSGD